MLKTVDSPVLQREGYTKNSFEQSGNPVPTMEGNDQYSSLYAYLRLSTPNAEWTFAKQKWQRTKNVVRGDQKFENAQILPGHREQLYA